MTTRAELVFRGTGATAGRHSGTSRTSWRSNNVAWVVKPIIQSQERWAPGHLRSRTTILRSATGSSPRLGRAHANQLQCRASSDYMRAAVIEGA